MQSDIKLKKIRIAGLSLIAFFLMFSYSIARPLTESLFIEIHTSKSLPNVWLFVSVIMIGVVYIYNRNVVRFDLLKLFAIITFLSAAIVAALTLAVKIQLPGIYYILYIWKDIYMVVLVEIYYSYSNSVFHIKTARWVYPFFGIVSGIAGILGGLIIGEIAKNITTLTSLWIIPLILIILGFLSLTLKKLAGIGVPVSHNSKQANIKKNLDIIRKSSYLLLVLILIAIVQIVITMIDYEYNSIVESTYPNVDIRTGIIGKIYAAIALGTLFIHFLTGPILRLAKVPATLLAIPILLGSGIGVFAAARSFITMAITKIMSKSFDYTIFRTAKEMLYIPLVYSEKTMGKSIIDMMTYRVAKGGASFFLLILVALNISKITTWVTLGLIILWIIITVIINHRFRKKVSSYEEIKSDTLNL